MDMVETTEGSGT